MSLTKNGKKKQAVPILHGLKDEEKRLYQEFLSAEKYLKEFTKDKGFEELVENIEKLIRATTKLHRLSLKLISRNIGAYTSLQIDQRLWQVSVYEIVTLGRLASANNVASKENVADYVYRFLKLALLHFRELVQLIEEKYPYERDILSGKANFIDSNTKSSASLCLPRILVSLGDTLRYSTSKDPNALKLSTEAFEKARSIDPENGRIYHQLGIVALLRKDNLTALYNFVRAYTSNQSVEAAKQQFYIVFDEAVKIYQTVSSSFWYNTSKRKEISNLHEVRRQRWLLPDQTFTKPINSITNTDVKEAHCGNLSSIELSKRFSLCYIMVIGKLFTDIGFESINEISEEALIYLEAMIKKGNIPALRIIHVITINIFILEHLKNHAQPDSVRVTTALQFSLEVFTLLIQRLNRLLDICAWDDPQMEVICIGLNIWTEWMRMNTKDWPRRRHRPIFSILRAHLSQAENVNERLDDVWITFSQLMTRLEAMLTRYQQFVFPSVSKEMDDRNQCCISPFPECKHMFGFPPLSNAQMFRQVYYCNNIKKSGLGRNLVRLKSIYRFGIRIVCEKFRILQYKIINRTPVFFTEQTVRKISSESDIAGFSVLHPQFWINKLSLKNTKDFENIVSSNGDCNNRNRIILLKKSDLNIASNLTPTLVNSDEDDISKTSTMNPPSVPFKMKSTRNYEIWKCLSEKNFQTEIIILPQHQLVLDTNCFAGNLNFVKILQNLVTRPLFIPIPVILELKGLAKGGFKSKDKSNLTKSSNFDLNEDNFEENQERLLDGMELAENCKNALSYISDNRDYFNIITSTGRLTKIKNPYSFIVDDSFDPTMNNDDRILESCKYLELEDGCTREMDTPRTIHRKTILITGDRFLRIKALSIDIPSRPIGSIIFWYYSYLQPSLLNELLVISKSLRRNLYLQRKQNRLEKQRSAIAILN